MKKTIVPVIAAFILVLTMCVPARAQNTTSAQFGIKGGVNFSNLYTKDAESNKAMPGYNVGIFGQVPVAGNLAFRPEIYFTTKGANVTYNNAFADGTASFKLNYIEMPLLFVIKVNDNFSIHAGPYAAYLVGGNVKNKSNVTLFNFEQNINTNDYNKIDAGIAAGASIDFGSVSFGTRYSYGLSKVGKEKSFMGTTYTFPDANNGVLSFYFQVPLHKN